MKRWCSPTVFSTSLDKQEKEVKKIAASKKRQITVLKSKKKKTRTDSNYLLGFRAENLCVCVCEGGRKGSLIVKKNPSKTEAKNQPGIRKRAERISRFSTDSYEDPLRWGGGGRERERERENLEIPLRCLKDSEGFPALWARFFVIDFCYQRKFTLMTGATYLLSYEQRVIYC